MIRYTLKCAGDHRFDSWFQSADAYDTLKVTGQLACPDCGSTRIDKALMAPGVSATKEGADTSSLTRLRREIEANSDYVGADFATQARAMHGGEAPHRPIYGEAAPIEAKKLIEDGVPIARLPFVPKAKVN